MATEYPNESLPIDEAAWRLGENPVSPDPVEPHEEDFEERDITPAVRELPIDPDRATRHGRNLLDGFDTDE